MVAFAMKGMGGEIPRMESRMLPDNSAEQAVNCDLSSGALDGLPSPQLTIDLSAHGTVRRAYRLPDPTGGAADAWIPLPSEFSSVVRSPLANDTNHRVYWTNPGDAAPHWNTYAGLIANTPAFDLGIVQPSTTVAPTVTSSGGVATPLVDRSYTYTFVDQYGEESAPCLPSAVVSGASDGTWVVTDYPTTVPPNPAGFNYPAVTGINIYRTVTGTQTGAQFYFVAALTYALGVPATFADTTSDTTIVNNLALVSSGFGNPPAQLDGLVALLGGMLVGFTGNTVHFCEPDRPHAWPAAYDQSLQYDIVGFGVWQQSLVVLTKGFPSTGSGNSPSNFVFTQVRVPEPCISRGSIITDFMGVYYASQNGLVMMNYLGMQNQTLSSMTKNIWLTTFRAADIIACRHRAQYLAINGTGRGFLIDYTEQRLGVMNLSTLNNAVCVWNDEYTGDAYIIADGVVYLWDSPTTESLIFRWRSKQFYGTAPVSLSACQISLDPSVETPPTTEQLAAPPLTNSDPTLVLPAGVNAVFHLYAGPDGRNLVLSKNLTKARSIFRLPSGFKSFDWQCEIVSRVPVHSIELASTMRELKSA